MLGLSRRWRLSWVCGLCWEAGTAWVILEHELGLGLRILPGMGLGFGMGLKAWYWDWETDWC